MSRIVFFHDVIFLYTQDKIFEHCISYTIFSLASISDNSSNLYQDFDPLYPAL